MIDTLKEKVTILAAVLCDLYVIGVLMIAAGAWLTNDGFWVFALLINLLPWLLLPVSVTALVAVISRQPARLLLNGTALAVFLIAYGPLFVPRPAASAADGVPLRVMTFNTWGHFGEDRDDIIAAIREGDADLVALQEVHTSTAEYIEAELSESYPYMALYPAGGNGVDGVGMLSRYPIIEEEYFTSRGPLPHLRTVIEVEGQPLTAFSVHPATPGIRRSVFVHYDDSLRNADIAQIAERVDQTPTPVLLMGDFNMTRHSGDWRVIRGTGLHDAYLLEGWGFGMTYPAGPRPLPPVVRIDYVFVSDAFSVRQAWVGEAMSADHKPVLAEVILQRVDP